MGKLVCGVGINDADYVVKKSEVVGYVDGKQRRKWVRLCPFYRTWASMLTRCFSDKYKAKQPTYTDVACCEEWYLFSNFKSWMEQQGWEGRQLDKDILVPDNKVYNSETCAFVSQTTNLFVTASDASRGEHPLGVCWSKEKGKFKAQCKNPFTKKGEFLGYFDCPKEAHEAWRKRKHELAQLVAELETDPRVVESMKRRYSIEMWYASR